MSTTNSEIDSAASQASTRIAREKSHWFERWNELLADGCSPLLVKETRQALKSRQFLYTYFLLLVAVASWVMIGISWNQWWGNSNEQVSGRELLYGMYVLLAIPLGIVIPFAAYRSLAKEFEDGTIQLISITTMKPYQILVGKLGSAILQMLVYLSVLAPSILLGYLLRGVSLPQILFTLAVAVFASLCLTVLGLFLGGVTKGKGFSTVITVAFILLLALLNYGWFWLIDELLSMPSFEGDEGRLVIFMFFIHPTAFALLLLIAAATQISFRADNHATPLRIAMLIHQALYVGSIVTILRFEGYFPKEGVGVCTMIAAHYWLAMGFLMIGEAPQMSRRIRRTLPTTWTGRTFKSLLMPGPGRGYLFALSMLWSCGLIFALLAAFDSEIGVILGALFAIGPARSSFQTQTSPFDLLHVVFLTSFYPTAYLSIAYLFAKWRLHRTSTRPVGAGPTIMFLFGCFFVASSMLIALLIHTRFGEGARWNEDSYASYCNWYWMFSDAMGSGQLGGWAWAISFVIPVSALVVFALILASRELLIDPMAVPERVLEDSKTVEPQLPAGESIEEIFGAAKK